MAVLERIVVLCRRAVCMRQYQLGTVKVKFIVNIFVTFWDLWSLCYASLSQKGSDFSGAVISNHQSASVCEIRYCPQGIIASYFVTFWGLVRDLLQKLSKIVFVLVGWYCDVFGEWIAHVRGIEASGRRNWA